MVVDAFIYMFVVGLGLSLGVATTALISWKAWGRIGNKPSKKRKERKGAIL